MNSNLNLFPKSLCDRPFGIASGKCILIGEHSAVYGAPALSFPLHQCSLASTLNTSLEESNVSLFQVYSPISSKDDFRTRQAWTTSMLSQSQQNELRCAFTLALQEVQLDATLERLSQFEQGNTKIEIFSHIPLGAGMGGSAALAVSFLRLAEGILCSRAENLIESANKIETIFHGKSSGLDVATASAKGLVQFDSITKKTFPVETNLRLNYVLVDSLERTPTKTMVELVRQNYVSNIPILKKIELLTQECLLALNSNTLGRVCESLNAAQQELIALGIAFPSNQRVCSELLQAGALAAKVTGAGGGGLCLGIFSSLQEAEDFRKNCSLPCWVGRT